MGKPSDTDPFVPARERPLLERAVPVSARLREYRTHTAGHDLIAGLTVAALALPSAMAYAELAGLSPVIGLYALLLPTIAYAVLGSSRQLVIGPEGSLSALVAAAILPLAAAGSSKAAGLAALLGLLVGACFIIARLLRLGWIADYLSRPVLVGYIHGVAVVLVIGQLGKLLGLDIDATDPIPQLVEVVREVGHVSGSTFAVGAAALAVLLSLRLLAPRVPAPLLVVVGGIVASSALDLAAHGVAVVGDVPSGLPSLQLPPLGASDVAQLMPAAGGLFLVAMADALLTARSYAGQHGQHIDASQELLALGAANAAAGVSQGFPVGASGSRTAVNDSMGARSQIAGLVSAGAIVVILLLLTAPIGDLPKAVLGAAIVSAALGLIDISAWRALAVADRVEVAIAGVTMTGVIVSGVLEAIGFAVGLSIVDVVRRSARPHDAVLGWAPKLGRYADVSVHPSAEITPGVVIYRLDDRLFFANASYVKGRVGEALRGASTKPAWLVFDAEALTHVDSAGIEAFRDLTRTLGDQGVTLLVARMKTPVRLKFDEGFSSDQSGPAGYYPTVRDAVSAVVDGSVATDDRTRPGQHV